MKKNVEAKQHLAALILPNATVFLASACIMTIELVAGRLIARHVGMSLYTWTAVIGIIMAGISLGNYLGGKIADRCRARHTLAGLFFAAAIGCVAILPLNAIVGNLPLLPGFSWPVRIFLHVFFVFIIPSTVLGMISPIVAKMALDSKRAAGRTVGGIFACSVVGSLVGTFATGYYLVMVLGATAILLMSALGLALLGAIYVVIIFKSPEETLPPAPLPASASRDLWTTLTDWSPAAGTVFMSNMAFMVFELAAMRVVSQEFGGSLYTWTTVIGVVLAGISLGNYIGGRLADRSHSNTLIMAVFVLSAASVLISPTWGVLMRSWRQEIFFFARMSWPMQIFWHVSMLCFVPCVFIGMVSPIVTRRLLERGRSPGSAVGAIYAWGSVGAIFGTFLAGYFLIQWMGALPVIALTSVLLIVVAVAYTPRNPVAYMLAVVCLFFLISSVAPAGWLATPGEKLRLRTPAKAGVVYEDESQYSYIAIQEDPKEPMLRNMLLDQLIHSMVDLRDPTKLLYEYEWVYSAVIDKRHPYPQPVRAFVIGGGGYAYPNYLAHARPGSDVVVAEIDPAVTEAAYAALGLPRDTPIEIYNMDARNIADDLLRKMANEPGFQKFDYIFGDSINDYTVPYHLTTLEFKRIVDALLADDGIYMLNMIDMLDSGGFLAAMVNTCRKVFPHVSVFNTGRATFVRDTFILVCTKQPLAVEDIPDQLRKQHDKYLGKLISDSMIDGLIEKHRNIILTDDFAPVENLIAPVVRTRAGDFGELNLKFARRYAEQGDLKKAVEKCRTAIAIHPQWPEAYEVLAEILYNQGDVDGAYQALVKAVDGHETPGEAWYKAGRFAFDMGRTDSALIAWKSCVAAQPDHVLGWYNLGVLYGSANDLQGAVNAWKNALAHQPNHEDSLFNLAAAYVMMGDGPAASAVLDSMRQSGITVDPSLAAAVQALLQPRPSQETP